jgi:hypothetical protein
MTNKIVEKDERTTFIENISYRYGYNFIVFALLFDVMYRSAILNEAPWDLLGINIISGLVMTIYQYKHKILGKTWRKNIVLTVVIALIFGIILGYLMVLI